MAADDADIDALYAGSLHGFVAARKALSKRLRAGGDKRSADEVDKLQKPSLPAWVLNRLVRTHGELMAAFLASIDRQRDLQLAALDGSVNADALRDAKQVETTALAALSERLPELLDADGHAVTRGTVDRVQRALRAAALNPETRALLERGRLTDEQASAGFDAVAAQLDPALLMAALRGGQSRPPKPKGKVDAFFARAARGRSAEPGREVPTATAGTRAERPQREDAARERERQARDRAERLARAKLTVAEARAELEALREQNEAQQARVRELTEALATATAEARASQRRMGQLKERLAKSEKRVRILDD